MDDRAVRQFEVRDNLTRNAFRFLARAADDLGGSPRDALLHLCAGIELLMKARLAHEHWSLVVDQPGSRSLAEVVSGDFKSVAFVDAIKRLEKLTGTGFKADDRRLLESIAHHRNKLVHFYHRDLDGVDEVLRTEVAKEECRAWGLFRQLLAGPWKEAFPNADGPLCLLQGKLRKNQLYLSVLMDQIKPRLEQAQSEGREIGTCFDCGLNATLLQERRFSLLEAECLVCGGGGGTVARLVCPSCEQTSRVACPDGRVRCPCGHEWAWPEVLASLGLSIRATADCWTCSDYGRGSAFGATDASAYVCLSCMTITSQLIACKSCSSTWVGAREESEQQCKACGKASTLRSRLIGGRAIHKDNGEESERMRE